MFFQERNFLMDQGHYVVDFSMADEKNFTSSYADYFVPNTCYNTSSGSIQTIKMAGSFIHSSVAVQQLEALLIREKPQIAHLHNIYHQLTPSIIHVLKKYGVKVVLTLHDYKLVCPSYLALRNEVVCEACTNGKYWNAFFLNCQNSRSRGFLLSIEALYHKWKGTYDLVDLFLAPSCFLAHLIEERIPKEKITVLRNGIDANSYLPGFLDQSYVLYLGRLAKEKGIKTLLNAYEKLQTNLPIKIAGTGPLEFVLRKENPEVDFLGYQCGQKLKDLIRNSAFVVVPSEWYENCSMVVLESMALGKPVIGSNIGGIPEQIDDGETGFLFEMGNSVELSKKMRILIEDKELRISMGRAARAKFEREFTLAKHCSTLMAIYNDLLT